MRWLIATCLLLSVAHATPECDRMLQLVAQHAAEAAKPDSDPAALNRLQDQVVTARDACLRSTVTSDETVSAALTALEHPTYIVPVDKVGATPASPPGAKKGNTSRDFSFTAEIPVAGTVTWGLASMPCLMLSGKCYPLEKPAPNMIIDKRVTLPDGRAARIRIKGSGSKPPSATHIALKLLHERFQQAFGRELDVTEGRLAMFNLANFQKEWAERHYKKGMSEKAAAEAAVKVISFGEQRMKAPFNYTQFTVDWGKKVEMKLRLSGDAEEVPYQVPADVDVTAKGRK